MISFVGMKKIIRLFCFSDISHLSTSYWRGWLKRGLKQRRWQRQREWLKSIYWFRLEKQQLNLHCCMHHASFCCRYSPLESTPEEFPNIKQIVWNRTKVLNFEKTQTRFISFQVTFSLLWLLWLLKLPNSSGKVTCYIATLLWCDSQNQMYWTLCPS